MEDEATHTMPIMREVPGKSLLQREETRLKRRKEKLNEIITEKRLERPSKQNQRQVEEVKEEDQEPKGFLPFTSTSERNSFDQKENIKARDAGNVVHLAI